jgi:peptidoglycan/LPS O-acetylase OafA/YrhL
MSTDNEKWNLDRAPTKWEHIYASIFSMLIFVIMSLLLYTSFFMALEKGDDENAWATFVVVVLLFIGSGYLLLRVVFGKRRKPSGRAILITGYVIGATSCLLLALSVLGLSNNFYITGIGFTGLAGSSLIIRQGRRRGNS